VSHTLRSGFGCKTGTARNGPTSISASNTYLPILQRTLLTASISSEELRRARQTFLTPIVPSFTTLQPCPQTRCRYAVCVAAPPHMQCCVLFPSIAVGTINCISNRLQPLPNYTYISCLCFVVPRSVLNSSCLGCITAVCRCRGRLCRWSGICCHRGGHDDACWEEASWISLARSSQTGPRWQRGGRADG